MVTSLQTIVRRRLSFLRRADDGHHIYFRRSKRIQFRESLADPLAVIGNGKLGHEPYRLQRLLH
jgi:hypothetical protein